MQTDTWYQIRIKNKQIQIKGYFVKNIKKRGLFKNGPALTDGILNIELKNELCWIWDQFWYGYLISDGDI